MRLSEEAIELVIIRTTGDAIQDRPLSEVGGKGLFTKEIEEALLGNRIDLAVHSAKDMPTFSQPGLILTACLEREDPRDVFISRKAKSFAELPQGATLGTASLRRQAIAKSQAAGSARRAVARQCRDAACASSTAARSTPPCWRSPA